MTLYNYSSQKKPAEKTTTKESAKKDKQKTADVKESSKSEDTKKEAESDKKARLLIHSFSNTFLYIHRQFMFYTYYFLRKSKGQLHTVA